MLPVLDLDPMWRSAGAIWPVAMFRYQPLQSHQAGVSEQVLADLALLEVGKEDAIDAAREQPGQVCLPHAKIFAIAHADVEVVKLHLVIMLARVQAVEIRSAVDA